MHKRNYIIIFNYYRRWQPDNMQSTLINDIKTSFYFSPWLEMKISLLGIKLMSGHFNDARGIIK